MSLIGRCCHCENIVSGTVPMAMDLDGRYHNRSPQHQTRPYNEWFVRADGYSSRFPAGFLNYRIEYRPSADADRWTDWLYLTNQLTVDTIPNPYSSVLGFFGFENLAGQGFFPRSHFMRPTRLTGFSGQGFRPFPAQGNPQLYAADAVEWRLWLDGELLSNDPEENAFPLSSLNLPGFEPDPEETENATYRFENSKLEMALRWKLSEWVSDGVQIKVHPHHVNGLTIDVGYDFENGFEQRSRYMTVDPVRGGVGWYHANEDPDQAIGGSSGVLYNLVTNFFTGTLTRTDSTLGYASRTATGYLPEGSAACPFGPPVLYDQNGTVLGEHPVWGYPQEGATTFHRHWTDRSGSSETFEWRYEPRFSPNSKTKVLVPGRDPTVITYMVGSLERQSTLENWVRRDFNYLGERYEPADPYWPPS